MSLKNLYRHTLKKPIKLYWWQYQYPDKLNFGDELTPYLIKHLFGRKTVWAEPQHCELAGAGSLIEILQDHTHGNEVTVWGSGFIRSGPVNSSANLHFVGVRGKLSRDRVGIDTLALGDPGLLMPLVFTPKSSVRYRLGIVPHYVDQDNAALEPLRKRDDVLIIDALQPPEEVIKMITSCEFIVSSSLHGLIMGDAYGVPNRWMPFSDSLTGKDYKFKDYYSVFDEKPRPLSPDQLPTLDIDKFVAEYVPKANLGKIQNDLMRAFPY